MDSSSSLTSTVTYARNVVLMLHSCKNVLGWFSDWYLYHNCTLQLLKNMGEILKSGGASYSSVVKTTILYGICALPYFELYWMLQDDYIILFISSRLADLKDFKKVNEIYAKCEFCGGDFNISLILSVHILALTKQSI